MGLFDCPNRFQVEIFKSCFMYEGNMFETGYPRNDLLLANNEMKYR